MNADNIGSKYPIKTLTFKIGVNELMHEAAKKGELDPKIIMKAIEKQIIDFALGFPHMPDEAMFVPIDDRIK